MDCDPITANFIKGYEDYISELFIEHKANATNKNGNQTRVNLCPLGFNNVHLYDVKLKKSVKNIYFIQVWFQPETRIISGEKRKIAPISWTLFESSVNDIGILYNHQFKVRPKNMDQLEYLQHICRRLITWIGKAINVGISYEVGIIRDAYDEIQFEGTGYGKWIRKTYYPRLSKYFNWDTAITRNERDKADYLKWQEEKGNFKAIF